MSFDTTNGTRGARQPKGPFLKWMNSLVAGRIARKGPLGWFPGADGSWLVVAAAAGAPKNPAWYYNLKAHPDDVSIEVPGGPVAVRAEQLHGAEREEAWRSIVAASAQFGGYQEKTDRELPVIRLVRRAA